MTGKTINTWGVVNCFCEAEFGIKLPPHNIVRRIECILVRDRVAICEDRGFFFLAWCCSFFMIKAPSGASHDCLSFAVDSLLTNEPSLPKHNIHAHLLYVFDVEVNVRE